MRSLLNLLGLKLRNTSWDGHQCTARDDTGKEGKNGKEGKEGKGKGKK